MNKQIDEKNIIPFFPLQGFRDLPEEDDEGIVGQVDTDGNALAGGSISVSKLEVLDMISEGPINGLVSGKYNYDQTTTLGYTGWNAVKFTQYPDPEGYTNGGWLRSIYWDETPVVNSANKFNYQRVSISTTVGTPDGAEESDGSIVGLQNQELTTTRLKNEELRASLVDPEQYTVSVVDDNSKVYRILNRDCKGVIVNIKINQLSRSVRQLKETDEASGQKSIYGDIRATSVKYRIYYKPIFSRGSLGSTSDEAIDGTPNFYKLAKTVELKGKINYGFIKASRVDFYVGRMDDPNFTGWEIKLVRMTPDSLTSSLRDQTFVESITEIYEEAFVYPYSALVRSRFSAKFFQSIPSRAFHIEGLKVKIPNNYNPVMKTYGETRGGSGVTGGDADIDGTTEVWDGTFGANKKYTNNPAWCFYDLCTNRIYGLGLYISESFIDKWTLFKIGQYCDEIVQNGRGGKEPRFTCNVVMNSREEAFKVLNDMASIFRGLLYYGAGSINAVQDRSAESEFQFNNTNVEEGDFKYSSSSKKARHTVATVRFNDESNFFKPAIEYVEDLDGIRQYGIKPIEVAAFGTTSRGQAFRLGYWTTLTERLNINTVTFTAGMEGTYIRPGSVIGVYDTYKKVKRKSGRTFSITGYTQPGILLDDNITDLTAGTTYQLELLTPTYNYEATTVTDIDSSDFDNIRRNQVQTATFLGSDMTTVDGRSHIDIDVISKFNTTDYIVTGNLVWSISLTDGTTYTTGESATFLDPDEDLYKVINKVEKEGYKFEITALQYDPNKFETLSNGTTYERPLSGWDSEPSDLGDGDAYTT